SWKIMLISLPRMPRISRSEHFSSSSPWKRIEPAIFAGGSGTRRRIDIAVTDFPQPLSPTTASVSPSFTWNEMPSTARLTPALVRKCVCKSSISSRAMSQSFGHARIERIAPAVAEQVDREHGDGEEHGGKEDDEGLHLPERPALGHDVAPRWRNRRRAGADEGQDRLDNHCAGAHIRGLHGHRR